MEVACRLTRAIALPPAEADIGWSIGGIVCGISSALAAGRLLRLDTQQLVMALGIAASEAAGTRAEHGTMAAGLIFGQAAQTGVRSAILAADGFTSSTRSLDGKHGYSLMFSRRPNLEALVANLGETFEVAHTTYKPFPTDIAIHPAIDAMLQLKGEHSFSSQAIRHMRVHASDLERHSAIARRPPTSWRRSSVSSIGWLPPHSMGPREFSRAATPSSATRRSDGCAPPSS